MSFDLSAIPDFHEENAPPASQDSPAAEVGLAAVVKALAPLLSPLDAELKSIVERGAQLLTSTQRTLAS